MDMDLDSMTTAELRKALKSRSLKQGGKKSELKERLLSAIQSEADVIQESANPVDDTQHTDFADFEEYINDEYNRLNKGTEHHDDAVDIDDIIQSTTTDADIEDEEKNILLDSNYILNGDTPKEAVITENTVIMADFNDDSLSLNSKSKVEDRMKRFGTESNQIETESRKRRFQFETESSLPTKKQKLESNEERSKIFQRAQKFGTDLPKNFKLTKAQSAIVYKDEIGRAKRFGTEHLLPIQIKRAEMNAKKEERKKRFKGKETEITDAANPANANAANAANAGGNDTKLMERKLRFGTMNDTDKQKEREKRFGTMTNGGMKQKGQNGVRQRFGGNRGNGRKRGGFGASNNRKFNNGNNKKNNKGFVFSADDLDKINQRKMRFNAV